MHRDAIDAMARAAPAALAPARPFGPLAVPAGAFLRDGRQPRRVSGFALLGAGSARASRGPRRLWSSGPSARDRVLSRAAEPHYAVCSIPRYTFCPGHAGREASTPFARARGHGRAGRRTSMRRAVTRFRRGEGAFGLIVGLVVLFVVVVALVRVVPLHIHGNEVLDAMNEAANFGGLKPLEKLQIRHLPERAGREGAAQAGRIHVEKNGSYIVISAKYEQTVGHLRLHLRLQVRQESREAGLLMARRHRGPRRSPRSGWTCGWTFRASSRRARRRRPRAPGARWT